MTPTEEIPKVKRSFYSLFLKRFFDILLSGFALIVLSPLLVIVSLLILITMGRPIFYTCRRPGKDGKVFNMYKFRSMTNERDAEGNLLTEDLRLTKLGLFLRRSSIDELPELFNILKGDMAIIGPRPLLIEYYDLYSPRHKMRQAVRPGLACVSLNKSNDDGKITWRKQFENDIAYIENISLVTDIRMIFAVAYEALCGSDSRTYDTRVPFDGKNLDESRSKDELESYIRYESTVK